MESIDPATGRALPADAIQRILFIANSVHVYNIPPLTSTKGYMAYDLTNDRICFLKDSWRPDTPNVHPEKEVYARLREAEVPYIPDLVAGGDVGGGKGVQRTRSQIFNNDTLTWDRIHYRLVFSHFYRPLSTHESAVDMLSCIADAIMGTFHVSVIV